MADDPGEVDRRLDARIAAADHRDALALEQRTVAMRAIGDALVAIVVLAGHVHLPPARTGRQDQRARAQRGAVLRSEEHTSELQSLMRISYAVFCLKKKTDIEKKREQYNTPSVSNK